MTQTEKNSPLTSYNLLLSQGKLRADNAQREAARLFEQLYTQFTQPADNTKSRFSWPWARNSSQPKPDAPIKHFYLWGDVGRGKTMLMDMFIDTLPSSIACKRIHFHAFMSEIHDQLHQQRQQQPEEPDPLTKVAAAYAEPLTLLCLDELQVHDIADAMILSRLFTLMLEYGVTVITTSNRPPKDLYLHGLQREQFLPFIALIDQQFTVHELASNTDYRLQKIRSHGCYFTPGSNIREMEKTYAELTHHNTAKATLRVKGREITISKAADGVAWCHFDELCRTALGANDYAALAAEFHTLFLTNIPKMTAEDRNEAKRFVTLIDTLYEHQTNLICSADTAPNEIYSDGDGSFEFHRTASRLYEMQSEGYLRSKHATF